jgi:hypothetical protein
VPPDKQWAVLELLVKACRPRGGTPLCHLRRTSRRSGRFPARESGRLPLLPGLMLRVAAFTEPVDPAQDLGAQGARQRHLGQFRDDGPKLPSMCKVPSGHERRSPRPFPTSALRSGSGRPCHVAPSEGRLASPRRECVASTPSAATRIPCACSCRWDTPTRFRRRFSRHSPLTLCLRSPRGHSSRPCSRRGTSSEGLARHAVQSRRVSSVSLGTHTSRHRRGLRAPGSALSWHPY